MEAEQIVISLGSNMGNRAGFLEKARLMLVAEMGNLISVSSVYQTASWGFKAADFYNQVLILSTLFSANECLLISQKIEKKLGRSEKTQDQKYADRNIDIDILFYGEKVHQESQLTIPHIKMEERKFVLAPMNELIPQFVHPIHQKQISELLQECQDTSEVIKLNEQI